MKNITIVGFTLLGILSLGACSTPEGGYEKPSADKNDKDVSEIKIDRKNLIEIFKESDKTMNSLKSVTIVSATDSVRTSNYMNKLNRCYSTRSDSSMSEASLYSDKTGSYLKGNATYWENSAESSQDSQAVVRIENRWIFMSKEPRNLDSCDLPAMASTTKIDENYKFAGAENWDGVVVYKITNNKKNQAYWINEAKPNYLVKVEDGDTTLRFSGFNGPPPFKAPNKKQALDLSQFVN